ncbi:hypothetical protein P872_18420 [Rhodonellum psychrophilum GCM71 = DSM 17998]|uniref:Terminase n=1 Tax=Rhodonellum psychrophilum GCM71 = DSM 17998 TaxID=1123057 RepID=U5BX03_9BACT|nr:terminase TerL endonuclease subunit [Rhodonellum psychrophilum]ERM82373.1 hypothetical protein P872_18420 [Rhodonellum psychrophilum GCM71 = DSM 17998]
MSQLISGQNTIDFTKIDHKKYYFDSYTADRAVRFIETFCSHVKGAMALKPYILQDWEKEIVSALFGWKHRKTGLRKFRESFIFLPRKNSKTTLSAAISVYMLMASGEKGAEAYFCASSRQQASISFEIFKSMIRQNKHLNSHLDLFRSSIEFKQTNSYFKVVSSEAGGLHGANLSFALLDELHSMPNAELYDVVKTSMGARLEPLLISITTAGSNKNHICHDLYEYSKKVIQGIIKDDTFLPIIFEGIEYKTDEELFSIKNIERANPSYGKSIQEDFIKELIAKAKSMPSFYNTFKQLHLNIWVDSAESWVSNNDWMANNVDYDENDMLGEDCWAGLDLANNRDLNAFVLAFPQPNGTIRTLNYTFLPQEAAERKDNISAGKAFLGWAKDPNNNLYLTDNRSRDDDFIYNKIEELSKKFKINNIAYDPWGADQLTTKLELNLGLKFTEFRQGYITMSPAIKKVESLIMENKLIHNSNPLLRWCISNVKIVKDDAGNVKMSKERSKEKIDAAVALVMAVGQYHRDVTTEIKDEFDKISPYDSKGFFFL